ncbi:MAG: metallophosphoesterase, partial [Theionarchaea archaeon]|nr:metallophosphoesterase [Theionarchaea archaeon]
IGHISDSHLAARMDMLEERWNRNFNDAWHKSSLSGGKPGDFSNYNSQFQHILKALNKDKTVDVIIHTGDITDYNKGYHNEEGENDLNRDYYLDKNWLLFYTLLYNSYEKPFFSVLGNHDYRLNPYSPNPVIIHRRIREFFNMAPTVNLTRSEMNTLHEDPYSLNIVRNHIVKEPYAVRWYSLVMNPLLDYQVFYGNMAFLMLDWNKEKESRCRGGHALFSL